MRTLVINSYAGSLTIGATSMGAEIVASMEDHDFFLDVQKRNFPNLQYVSYRHQWPSWDLSDTVVIGHPPCSGFSLANSSKAARGVESNAFACTKDLLKYACRLKAKVIAVESVMGALGGAWNVHQYFADEYGYHLYRIVENGIMFSPQWRERFWIIMVKKGVAPEVLPITLTPRWLSNHDVLDGYEDGPTTGNLDQLLVRQKGKLKDGLGLSDEEMSYYFDKQDPPHPTVALDTLIWEKKLKTPDTKPEDRYRITHKFVDGFNSSALTYLDPNGFAPVVMAGSHWYYNGRNLSEDGYKRIAGFPVDYVFPETPKNYRRQMRTGLSKGVIPAIARWILEVIACHIGETDGLTFEHHHDTWSSTQYGPGSYHVDLEPNDIADFRIKKQDWPDRLTTMPPLRHYDDHPRISKVSYGPANGVEDLTEVQVAVLQRAQNALIMCGNIEGIGLARLDEVTATVTVIDTVLNPPPPAVLEVKVKTPKVQRVGKRVMREGEVWVSGLPTTCLNPACGVELPADQERHEEPSMNVIVGSFVCPACGETSLYSRKPDKPIKVRAERQVTAPRGRLSDVGLAATDVPVSGFGARDQKRAVIQRLIREAGVMTHAEAIEVCCPHPEINLLFATCHWHIRQLVKFGMLREVSPEDVAHLRAKAAGQEYFTEMEANQEAIADITT
jgi:site-specific DNA-cytosine methylase